MNFRTWYKTENSLFSPMVPNINRGSNTPASDEVKRTGLQPQVNAEEIHTPQKEVQKQLKDIDSMIKNADRDLPAGKQEDPKLNKFCNLWEKFKKKWEKIKNSTEEINNVSGVGLGSETGDQRMIAMMRQRPNMTPENPNNFPQGPGIFGQS